MAENNETKNGSNLTSVQKYGQSIRYRALINLALIVYLVAAIFIINERVNVNIRQHYEKMKDLMRTSVETYTADYEQQEICYELDKEDCDYYAKMITVFFYRDGLTQENVDKLQEELLDDGTLYAYDADGNLYAAESSPALNLSEEFLSELKENGYARDEETLQVYSYCTIKNGGEIIIMWNPLDLSMGNALESEAKGTNYAIMIVDQNNSIVASNDSEKYLKNFEEEHEVEDAVQYFKRVLKVDDEECGICQEKNSNKYFYMERQYSVDDNDLTVYIHYPIKTIAREVIPYVSKQLALMLLSFILLVRTTILFTIHLNPAEEPTDDTGDNVTLGVDNVRFSHLLGLFLVCSVITISLTVYIQLLKGYSSYYLQARNNLNNITIKRDHYEENYKNITESFSNYYVDSAYLISDLIKMDPDFASTGSLKYISRQLINYFYPEEAETKPVITVYDKDGVSVASSTGYTGYTLSSDPNDSESECWKLLNNVEEHLVIGMDDATKNTCFVAVKREDDTGIIVMEINNQMYDTLKNYYTLSEAVNSTSFGQFSKLFVDTDKPDTIYATVIDGDDSFIDEIDYPVGDTLLTGEFEGEYRLVKAISPSNDTTNIIPAGIYYINELKANNIIYISMIKEETIIRGSIAGILHELIALLILMAIIIVYCNYSELMPKNHKKVKKAKNISSHKAGQMNALFQKDLHLLMIGSTAIMLVITALEHIFLSSEMLGFLYGSQWAHTVNLFSLTKIFIAILLVKFASLLITKFIELITNNLGHKFETAGKMVISLVRFGEVAFVVIYALVQFGAKLSYLLTGAGFAGIVIGYAGQSLINDLLSGLFIVFEGRIKVGDWITVDDWRGQVVEIGVRTTTVTYGGDVRVFNNSCLNTVTVWSPCMQGSVFIIRVDYGTDINKAINLILTNTKRYRDEIHGIIDGPYVSGVTEVNDNGIEIKIWATPESEGIASDVDIGLCLVTKKIFEENGIATPRSEIFLPGMEPKVEKVNH